MAWAGTPVQSTSAIPLLSAAGAAINSAANYRQGWIGALVAPAPGGPMLWRPGVLSSAAGTAAPNTDLAVSQTPTASVNVLVNPGTVVIPRSGVAGGPYLVTFTSVSTLVADPAPSTNPRIDVVAVQVVDNALGDVGTQGGQLFIVDGTPAATPSVPAIPTGAVALAQLYRAANSTSIVTANITDVRRGSATACGVRPLLPGDLSSDPGSYVGEYTYDAVTAYKSGPRIWDGSTWRGVRPKPLTAVWANGTSNIPITSSTTTIATCTVADPGYPYALRLSAQIDWSGYGTFTAGAGPWVSLRIALDSATGTILGASNGFAQATSAGLDAWSQYPSRTTATMTGAHTIYLTGAMGTSQTSTSFYSTWGTGTFLDVEVIPV